MGVFSSRKVVRMFKEHTALRYLCGGNFQKYKTIRRFRNKHKEAFTALFRRVLAPAIEGDDLKLKPIAIDGTKLRSTASKRKSTTYEELIRREAALKEDSAALVEKAEAMDAEEAERIASR